MRLHPLLLHIWLLLVLQNQDGAGQDVKLRLQDSSSQTDGGRPGDVPVTSRWRPGGSRRLWSSRQVSGPELSRSAQEADPLIPNKVFMDQPAERDQDQMFGGPVRLNWLWLDLI